MRGKNPDVEDVISRQEHILSSLPILVWMAPFDSDTEHLVGLFFGSILYGILTTTFLPSLASLLFKQEKRFELRPRKDIKIPVLLATIIMFLVSTCVAVFSVQTVIEGFVRYNGPGGPLQFFKDVSGWKYWATALSDGFQISVGDALLIYRCYVLHDRNWKKIVVPLISWFMIFGIGLMILSPARSFNDPSIVPLISVAMVLTFITSVSTTFLIIRRLCSVKPEVGSAPTHFLTRVAAIFFESGLIYTIPLVASLAVYLSKSHFEWTVSICMTHIVPITWNILLIRVKGTKSTKMRMRETAAGIQFLFTHALSRYERGHVIAFDTYSHRPPQLFEKPLPLRSQGYALTARLGKFYPHWMQSLIDQIGHFYRARLWHPIRKFSISCSNDYKTSLTEDKNIFSSLPLLVLMAPFERHTERLVGLFFGSILYVLIIRRLYSVKPEFSSAPTHFLTRVAAIFLETGLIYTLALVASLAVYLSKCHFEWTISVCMTHIIPITWNMLLIRVNGVRSHANPEIAADEPDEKASVGDNGWDPIFIHARPPAPRVGSCDSV
ncbi:unnamed protein product [Mycena citricolor]|uniref:Uncharacterized protein n=1 Tax=Mycena citricolor TaxID=2018698 RepID=A0AAD2H3Q2_9AGAR|nr:unnamed protein product [Mycena citricolor]